MSLKCQNIRETLIEMKEEIDKPIIIVGNFNTTLSVIDRSSRQKINTNISDLKNIINHFLIHICIILSNDSKIHIIL